MFIGCTMTELLTALANLQWWEWVLMITVPSLMGFLVWRDFGRKQSGVK